MSPSITALIQNNGWRSTYRFFIIFELVLVVLVLLTFVATPAEKGLLRIGEKKDSAQTVDTPAVKLDEPLPLKKLFTSPIFWLSVVILVLLATINNAWISNNNVFMTRDLGLDPMAAASILSIISIVQIIGMFITGAVSDKAGAKILVYCVSALFAITFIICLLASKNSNAIYGVIPFMGLAQSAAVLINTLLAHELYGTKRNFGAIIGWFTTASSFGGSFLPLTVTMIYDNTGSYNMAWVAICATCVVICGLITLVYHLKKSSANK